MSDEKKPSQLRRAADREVEHHFNWSRGYDALADLEFQRSPRRWPTYQTPRQPMAALPPNGTVRVDGQRAGSVPPEWSRTPSRGLVLASEPAEPMTEAEERARRVKRKQDELAAMHARSEARRQREQAEAERAGPPTPTMSEASRKHFMKLLDKRAR